MLASVLSGEVGVNKVCSCVKEKEKGKCLARGKIIA